MSDLPGRPDDETTTSRAPGWDEPIAIIGMAALFPKASSVQEYWANILGKVDCITDVPPTHWPIDDYFSADPKAPDKTYCKRGGFLPATPFDPAEFGIPPQVVKATDTAQLLGLVVARAALADAGCLGPEVDHAATSCILGVGSGLENARNLDNRIRGPVWRKVLLENGLAPHEADRICEQIADHFPAWEENSFPGLLSNVIAGRIANRLNLGGTNLTVDAACASGLAAAHTAVTELRSGQARMAITGAVDADNDAFMFMCFSKTPAFSPSNRVRPFDAGADGILIAEGIGLCVIKRLSEAQRDGDRIYAVIRALGSSSDGRYKSIYAPNPDGQATALRRAYQRAGISPGTIELVEAHGTGTTVGDLAEVASLSRVFREARNEGRWCALGSVKSQIGHSKATAGVAGLIKAALALHQKVLPPTINVAEPNPKMELDQGPLYLNTEARPWIRPTGSHPRRAAVSAFGFGGTNFHCVLEEVPGQDAPLSVPAPTSLFVFTGATAADALRSAALAIGAITAGERHFKHEAHRTLAQRARDARAVLAVVAASLRDLVEKVDGARPSLEAAPEAPLAMPHGVFYGFRSASAEPPKVAVLFPGQGSQYVNMGKDWTLRYPEVRRAFEDADRLFLDAGDRQLSTVVFPHPVFTRDAAEADDRRLTDTRWAQPALGALSMGLYALLHERLGLRAECFGGHSYGELTALWAAGVLDRDAFLHLSRTRGALMAEAAAGAGARSGMSALAGPVDALRELLPTWGGDVVLANINSPEQAVVAGAADALEKITAPAEAAGFRVRRLSVSAAFHSPFVAAARDPFAAAMASATFGQARQPVYSNTTARPYPDNGLRCDLLADQLVKPVDFLGVVKAMHAAGARIFVEVGPRSILTALVGRILKDAPHTAIALDPGSGKEHGDTALQKAVGHLLARGVELDLAYLLDREPLPAIESRAPSATTVMLSGSNTKPARADRPRLSLGARPEPTGHAVPVDAPGATTRTASQGAPAGAATPASPAPAEGSSGPTRTAPMPAATHASPPDPARVPVADQAAPPPSPGLAQTAHAALDAFMQQQQITAEVHQEFLRTSQEAMRTIVQLFELHARQMGGAAPAPRLPAPADPAAPDPAPGTVSSQSLPGGAAIAHETVAPAPLGPEATPPGDSRAAPEAAGSAAESSELAAGLLLIVSDKTGYPVDMLKLDMDLEADLGIDSIKRVEILGAMQAQFPEAATVETERLGELHTLQQILDYVGQSGSADQAVPGADGPADERPFDAIARPSPIRRYTVTTAPIVGDATTDPVTLPADHVILLTDDGRGYAAALGMELTDAGHSVVIAHLPSRPAPYADGVTVWPLDWTDEKALDQGLAALGLSVGGVIHLASLRETPAARDLDRSEVKALLAEQVRGAFLLARATSASLRKSAGLFATVTAIDGGFGLLTDRDGWFAPQGALAGLVKTLAIEWPGVTCRALDLEPSMAPGHAARELAREIMRRGGAVETGVSGDGRRGLLMTPATAPPATPLALGESSVVLVTGGARGVTADVALGLAERWRPTLVLLGRSPAPAGAYDWCRHIAEGAPLKAALRDRLRGQGVTVTPAELERVYRDALAEREIAATLHALRAAGSRVEYRSVDVRDAAAVAAVVRDARDLGPLAGLVHGAGVIHDKLIEQKTPEQFDHVFDTKVLGLHALLEALRHDDLEFIALFSSIAGRSGNKGQSDYAMANECLNKMALDLRIQRPGCRVVSIGWGPWQGGMVSPELERVFSGQGVQVIPRREGARFFLDEIAAGRDAGTEIVVAGLPAPRTLEFDVAPDEDRYLEDHRLNGKLVVPAMMVLEWMAQAAQSTFPGMRLTAVEEFRVLKGVGCEGPRTRVRLTIEEAAGSSARARVLAVRVFVVDGSEARPAYRASVRLMSEAPPAPAFAHSGDLAVSGYDLTVADAYRERLFHGPRFQVIDAIEGVSDRGMVARLRPSDPSGWNAHAPARWVTDPAMLDGALQVLVLWLREKLGAASLPTGIGAYVQYAAPSRAGYVTAAVRILDANARAGVADVAIVDGAGRVVAEMRNVEMTVSGNLNPMFRQSQVSRAVP